MESQRAWGGPNAEYKAKISPIWDDFEQLRQDAFDWYGMDENFYNISFNVLGVESGVPRDIAQRDTSLEVWKRYGDQIEGTRHDVIYEFDDRNEPRHEVQFPYGTEDPRDGDISSE